MYDFAQEVYFDEKTSGIKNINVKCPITLLHSPAIMASGI